MTPSASLRLFWNTPLQSNWPFSTCLAGVSTDHSPLQSVAGCCKPLPAVIAMQAEIPDDAAIHFANSPTKS